MINQVTNYKGTSRLTEPHVITNEVFRQQSFPGIERALEKQGFAWPERVRKLPT